MVGASSSSAHSASRSMSEVSRESASSGGLSDSERGREPSTPPPVKCAPMSSTPPTCTPPTTPQAQAQAGGAVSKAAVESQVAPRKLDFATCDSSCEELRRPASTTSTIASEDSSGSRGVALLEAHADDVEAQVHVGEEARELERGADDEQAPTRILFLSMLCIFQGYAVMVGPCQQKFKKALNVGQFGGDAELFTQAADFVHWGKFFMRIGHNVIFGFLTPRQRVLLSMCFMGVGCLIPPLCVFTLGMDWIGTVFLSYGFSGLGLGIFECTFLSVITPLGGRTKAFAITAVPAGFALINVVGLLLTSVGVPVENVYWYATACIPVGMVIFQLYAPRDSEVQVSSHKQANLRESLRAWRFWVPTMVPFLLAKFVTNFAMENITPVSFYTFNAKYVPLLDPAGTTNLMPHDIYFALLSFVTLLGNTGSLQIAYKLNVRRYCSFVVLMIITSIGSIVCCFLVSLKIAVMTLAAVFLAFWMTGSVYGLSATFIDRFLPKEYNLAAYSLWCMIGDLGPIWGGAMMDVLRAWICDGKVYAYTCRSSN
eukprot:TRINITY_DN38989_c0_g1_i1.p1 TRINITY_DN38989_c0_g1~~TRINITY_DN38989_c0_g1_i1.p1  ORF type:complete len:562 (-),score=127.50 TRINITY_DN38989_c0_g1_i1:125-1750(-)